MEIKDKKLVGALVAIIVILLIALGGLYFSTPKGMPLGERPDRPANLQYDGTNSTGSGTKNTNNAKDITGTTNNSAANPSDSATSAATD